MDRVIAEKAAADLRAYWATRGYEIRAEVERIDAGWQIGGVLYLVRSDLINGLPRGFRSKGFKIKTPIQKENVARG